MEKSITVINPYQARLVALCDRITANFDWDLDRETAEWEKNKSRRITADETLRKTVYKAKAEAATNHGLGIMLYNDWKANEFDPQMDEMKKVLGSDSEFKVPPTLLEAVNALVLEGKFKAYKYRDGRDKIGQHDKYHISKIIGFSSDLTLWLDHVQKQDEFLSKQSDDTVFVTMFGKMDEVHPLYSNWLFTMHKGSTIWIVTDQVDFDNPYQKHARLGRRSVWRDREEMYDSCDLPYDIFHNIDEERKKSMALESSDAHRREKFSLEFLNKHTFELRDAMTAFEKKFKAKLDDLGVKYDVVYPDIDGHGSFQRVVGGFARLDGRTVAFSNKDGIIIYKRPEFFFKDFKDLGDGQRAFVAMLIKELIQYLSAQNAKTPRIMLAKEFVEQKLLEGAQIDPGEPKHMEYWKDHHKKIFGELLETLEEGEPTTTALTLKTYDLVRKSEHYNASWLSTPEKMQSLSEWSVIDSEREKLEGKRRELYDQHRDAVDWLHKELSKNFVGLMAKLTHAKEINFRTQRYGAFIKEGKFEDAGSVFPFNNKSRSYQGKGHGVGKNGWKVEYCQCCGDRSSKVVKRMHVRHYRELMWLFGLEDRNKLHRYWRQYRAHNLVPYDGNSLLDQTHPYLRLTDPASRREANGFDIDLFMCGVCYNKIKQKDKMTIIYDGIDSKRPMEYKM